MSAFKTIQTRLNFAFPRQFKACFSIDTRSELEIIDYKGQSYFVAQINEDQTVTVKTNQGEATIVGVESDKTFKILNAKITGLIPIDGKNGLLGFGDSHCDCIVFNDTDFCFVEMKLNATSLKKANQKRHEGIKQLSNTVDLFDDKLERNYDGLRLEAYLCTPKIYPRENAAFQALRLAFLEEKGIELFEKAEKICR